MTEEEFYHKIHLQYLKSNSLLEGDGGFQIKRGMAHSVSGYTEDLFALFIAERLKRNDLIYYVDKVVSIRLRENARATSFKPDLLIIKNNVITHYFDLKTNLGWNRNAGAYLTQKNEFISQIRGKKAWINYNDRYDNATEAIIHNVTIAEDIKYEMLVLLGGNINQKQKIENSLSAENLEFVTMDVLRDKVPGEDRWKINRTGFDRLYESLEKLK